MGIDVAGESQLVGYPTRYPSVSMMNYKTGDPNARFWVLKLLKDHFGPGDKLVETKDGNHDLSIQAFQTSHGRQILMVNKHLKERRVTLPQDFKGCAYRLCRSVCRRSSIQLRQAMLGANGKA